MAQREVTIDLGDGMQIVALAEQAGPELVADEDVVAVLGAVTGPIEKVGRETLEAVKRAMPDKATVELHFGLAVEQGHLLALLGKGKGEASITVTLEWSAAGAQGG